MIVRIALHLCLMGAFVGTIQTVRSADDPFVAEAWSTEDLLEDYLSNPCETDAETERNIYFKRLLVHRSDDLVAMVPERALQSEHRSEINRCLQLLMDAKLRKNLLEVIDELLSRREQGGPLVCGVTVIGSFLAQLEAYEFAPRLVRYAKGDLGSEGQIAAFQALGRIGGAAELKVLEEEWLKIQAVRKHRPDGRQDFSKGEMICYQGSIDRLGARLDREQNGHEQDVGGSQIRSEQFRESPTGPGLPAAESPLRVPMAAAPVAANWALALSILFFGWGLWKYIRFRSEVSGS